MSNIITDLAAVIILAAIVGLFARWLRLPIIFAYLLTGVIITVSHLLPASSINIYHIFGDLGVMFLLFLIGLEINYASLKIVGISAVLIGLSQVSVAGAAGICLALLIGYSMTTAIFVGILIAFSSTVVVVQLLSEKHELNSLHGKLILGVMLMQDFIAIILLVALSGIKQNGGIVYTDLALTIVKGIVLVATMLAIGRWVFPRCLRFLSRVPELVFLLSLAWLFLVAGVTSALGLSVEIGGFLAGLALAESSEELHIGFRMRPLRDFFLILLFITLGSSIGSVDWRSIIGPVLSLSAFILLVNPLLVMMLVRFLGYHPRTAWISGLHISQLSEFSLVLAALGYGMGFISPTIVGTLTITALVTIGVSSFLIQHDEKVYNFIKIIWPPAEELRETNISAKKYDLILIGAHRIGSQIVNSLPHLKVLVIDFDPDVVAKLKAQHRDVINADIGDEEVIKDIIKARPRKIISTDPDIADNISLITAFRRSGLKNVQVIIRAENDKEAKMLYAHGADFVLLPHLMSGIGLGHALSQSRVNLLAKWRANDLRYLRQKS
jgi:Kef-type K+ transport system membrane component KefB